MFSALLKLFLYSRLEFEKNDNIYRHRAAKTGIDHKWPSKKKS